MRAAIIGAGSLGTIIGALMNRGGYPVDLIDSNTEHVQALNRVGARITGEMELLVPVKAYAPEEMSGQYDLVFLLNKQTANDVVLPRLLPFLHDDSIVCTLQNGIPEPRVASYVSAGRTIGVSEKAAWAHWAELCSDFPNALSAAEGSIAEQGFDKVHEVAEFRGR